jgi:hypothetical protein
MPTIRDLVVRNPAENKLVIRVVVLVAPSGHTALNLTILKSQSVAVLLFADAGTTDKLWPVGEWHV